jgi:hypothetical protein
MFGNDTLAHDLHFERGPSYALAHVRAHSHERLVRPLFFLNFPTCTEASDWPKEEPARSAKRLSHSPPALKSRPPPNKGSLLPHLNHTATDSPSTGRLPVEGGTDYAEADT